MRACLIFNPRAGTADRIKDFLLHLTGGARCELRPTTSELDASQIAREAVEEGFERIIVAGGDGTIGQVVNGIAPQFDSVVLAILPFGTGNDLARSLGITAERMDQACRSAFGESIERIDVVQITGDATGYCINVANGGLGGRVAVDVQSVDKKRWGPMAYWMTSATRIVNLQEYEVEMKLDTQTVSRRLLGMAVANGRFVGGGFPIAPRALLNDGMLDVTVIPVMPALELMTTGLNFAMGRDLSDGPISTFRVRRVHLTANPEMPFSVDGEPTRRFDATFEVLPQKLRVIVGPEPAGLIDAPSMTHVLY